MSVVKTDIIYSLYLQIFIVFDILKIFSSWDLACLLYPPSSFEAILSLSRKVQFSEKKSKQNNKILYWTIYWYFSILVAFYSRILSNMKSGKALSEFNFRINRKKNRDDDDIKFIITAFFSLSSRKRFSSYNCCHVPWETVDCYK